MEATAACFKSHLHSEIYLGTLKLIKLQGTKYEEYVLYMHCCIGCVVLGSMPIFVHNKAGYSRSLAKACIKQSWLGRLMVLIDWLMIGLTDWLHFQSVLKNKWELLFVYGSDLSKNYMFTFRASAVTCNRLKPVFTWNCLLGAMICWICYLS